MEGLKKRLRYKAIFSNIHYPKTKPGIFWEWTVTNSGGWTNESIA